MELSVDTEEASPENISRLMGVITEWQGKFTGEVARMEPDMRIAMDKGLEVDIGNHDCLSATHELATKLANLGTRLFARFTCAEGDKSDSY